MIASGFKVNSKSPEPFDLVGSMTASKLALLFVKLRLVALLVALTITGVMGYFAIHLGFNFSPDNIYLAGDDAYEFYVKRFYPVFGDRAKVCIVAIDGSMREPPVQKALFDLHQALEKPKSLGDIQSLVNTSVFQEKDDVLQLLPIFAQDGTPNQALLDWAAQDALMNKLLIAPDESAAAVAIRLPLRNGDDDFNDKLVDSLRSVVNQVALEHPKQKFYLTGLPVTQDATISLLKHDQMVFVPFVALLMGILLFFAFRSLRGVILPFLAAGAATIWALGWLVLEGHSLNLVNNSLIVLLLVIGVADAIHVLARFEYELRLMRKKEHETGTPVNKYHLVARTLQLMLIPVTLTTTVAAIGFASSYMANVEIIRDFGVDAALGVMGSLFTTLLIVIPLLAYLPLPKHVAKWPPPARIKKLSMDHILAAVTRFAIRFAKPIIAVTVLLGLASAWWARDLRPNQTLIGELPVSDPAVQGMHFIEQKFTGIMPFDVVFEGTQADFENPSVLRQLAQTEDFIRGQTLTPTVLGYTDVLQAFDKSLSNGKDLTSVADWDDGKIAQLLILMDMSDPDMAKLAKQDFMSPDGKLYRLQGLVKDANTSQYAELRSAIERYLKEHPIVGLKSHVTGATMITAKALNHVMDDLAKSLGLGIVIIFALMTLLFRSVKFGLIGLLPNLLPIVMTAAFMTTFDISFRVATVIIFTMAIGIAVDTSIHLLTRFKQEIHFQHLHDLEPKQSLVQSILVRTIQGSGRPVVYAMLILLAGFSVLGFSRFVALRDFAMLSAFTLGVSLVIDLLLVPALIVVVKPKLE